MQGTANLASCLFVGWILLSLATEVYGSWYPLLATMDTAQAKQYRTNKGDDDVRQTFVALDVLWCASLLWLQALWAIVSDSFEVHSMSNLAQQLRLACLQLRVIRGYDKGVK